MIDNGTVDESSYDRNDSKVFCLPSISRIVLDDETFDSNGRSNHDSLNFADLMNMKPPDGVDFHASYDQVPKAKVKITKKLKMKKDANNSCPVLGYNNETHVPGKKSRPEKPKMKGLKRSKSAVPSRPGPSRSISFTTSPPCHLGVEVPTPIMPKRTQSMPWGSNLMRSSEPENNDASKLSISAASAFSVNSHNSSFTSTEKRIKHATDIASHNIRRPLQQQAFTIMPSESGNFMATILPPTVGESSFDVSDSSQSRRRPLRSMPKKTTRTNQEAITSSPPMQERDSTQFKVESPLARSASWDDLGIAIFKSPIKCEVSRRTLSRRKSSKTTMESPNVARRTSAISAEPILTSPRRGSSPRRSSRRSYFLDRSKSAKLLKDTGLALTTGPSTTGTFQPLEPRRTKSLYTTPTTDKPCPSSSRPSRTPLKLPNHHSAGRPLHDDVSVSASEAVPIASLVFAKNCPDKSHLKKAFKDTLDLVGKWKRKSQQESRDRSNPVKADDDLIGSVASVVDSSRKEERHRHEHKGAPANKPKLTGRKSWNNVTPSTTTTTPTNSSRSRSDKSHSSRKKERQQSDHDDSVVKDSLADAIEEKEARLEMYLMKTPQAERKKVDRYWIEAFKRNYAKRNDLLLDVDK